MPEFDINTAMGTEVKAMVALADLASTCAAVQDLARAPGDAATAFSKIKVCDPTEPWDQNANKITLAQLVEEIGFQIDISPGDEEEYTASVNVGDPEGECPDVTGAFAMRVIWWVTDEEWQEFGGQDRYLMFLDRVAGMCEQLHGRADATGLLYVKRVRRMGKPLWNEEDSLATQGRHLWAEVVVEYGTRFSDDS